MSEPQETLQENPISTDEVARINRRREIASQPGVGSTRQSWALAFSGGGIRSATICFGLARALAASGSWRRFDYLSTVSGGGYIGSALGRLYSPAAQADEVEKGLASDDSLLLWWLRANGRFLAPHGGSDILRAVAGYVRGLVATQFEVAMLLLLLSSGLVLTHVGALISPVLGPLSQLGTPAWALLPPIGAAILIVILGYWFTRERGESSARIADGVVALAATGVGLTVGFGACDAVRSDSGQGAALTVAATIMLCVPAAWLLQLLLSGRTPRAARVRLTAWLGWLLVAALACALLGLLDLLTWQLAAQFTVLPLRNLGVGASVGVFALTLLRGLVGRLATPSSSVAGISLFGLASFAGLVLSLLLVVIWLSFAQWLVFFSWPDELGPPFGFTKPLGPVWRALLLLLVTLVFVGVTSATCRKSLTVLNLASQYNYYRSRLARAYVALGNSVGPAARFPVSPLTDRDQQVGPPGAQEKVTSKVAKVTDFRPGDDVSLAEYRPHEHGGPLHLIGVCVNQTTDDRTDTYNADRKGVALTVSQLGVEFGTRLPEAPGDVAATELSHWIAISGAAAGSGMGSQTTSGLAALLYLSGVRLGYWWVRRPSVFNKYRAILGEWFGSFPGLRAPALYLSDGGHFDNTGVYTLLKRRPQLIVCVDCGADPGYVFDDVENLVRKARIDYNAQIDFIEPRFLADLLGLSNPKSSEDLLGVADPKDIFGTPDSISPQPDERFLLLARVLYENGACSTLLIVKPRRRLSLSLDVAGYSDREPVFPQQTTGDQFYDEAQWESYCELGRGLGRWLSPKLLDKLPKAVEAVQQSQLATAGTLVSKPSVDRRADGAETKAAISAAADRRSRIAATVGKPLGLAAAFTLAATIWPAAKDAIEMRAKARGETMQVLKEADASLKIIRDRAAEPGEPAVKQYNKGENPAAIEGPVQMFVAGPADKATGDAMRDVVQKLQALAASQGEAQALETQSAIARTLGELCGSTDRKKLPLDASPNDVCNTALAALSAQPRGRFDRLLGRYWAPTLVDSESHNRSCERPVGQTPPELVIHDDRPDADSRAFLEIARQAAADAPLKLVIDRDPSGVDPGLTTLIAAVSDRECAARQLTAISANVAVQNPALSWMKPAGLAESFEASPMPVIAGLAGSMHLWLRRQPGTITAASTGETKQPPISLAQALAARTTPLTVYLQFQGSTTRDQINEAREVLRKAGAGKLSVPAAERVAGNWPDRVKYFRGENQAAALAIQRTVLEQLKTCRMDLYRYSLPVELANAPTAPDTVEVWVKPQCGPAK